MSQQPDEHRGRAGQLSAQAYERLRAGIGEGQFPPSVVIREIDLVREYGMSRTPIREALQRLQAEGFIRPAAPGRYVAVELGPKDLSDIYRVREALVGMGARLAAEQRSRVDLAKLEDILEAFDRACATSDDEAADRLVRAFYHAIADASGNDYLRSILGRLTDLFPYKALAVTHLEWRDWMRAEHLALVGAIADRDADRAERLGRELISRSLAIRIDELRTARAPQSVREEAG